MSEKPSVTDRKRESTRRRALHTIGGIVLGSSAIGTAAANRHVTEIDGPTIIDEPGEYVLTANISSDDGNRSPLIQIEADRVTLNGNGHTISRPSEAGGSGAVIEVSSVKNVTVSNLSLTGPSEGGVLRIRNGRNCLVEQITVTDSSAGISCSGTNNTIRQNSVSSTYESGISVSGSNNTVRNNDLLISEFALWVSGLNNTVRENDIAGGEDGITIRGGKHILQNNSVWGDFAAIGLWDSDDNNLVDNETQSGSATGFLLENSNNNTLTRNEARGAADGGIRLRESDNNTITRNEATDNGTGIVLGDSDYNTVARNDVRNNREEGIVDNGKNNRIHANITD